MHHYERCLMRYLQMLSCSAATVLISSVAFLTYGCSGSTPSTSAQETTPSESRSLDDIQKQAEEQKVDPKQQKALSGESVSLDDYKNAVQDARTCMTEKGLKVGPIVTNRIDGWRQLYTIDWAEGMSPDEGSKHSGHCQDHHVTFAERGYAAGNKDKMDPQVLAATTKCLGDAAQSLTGKEINHHQVVSATKVSQEDVADCIVTFMTNTFPGEQFAVVW